MHRLIFALQRHSDFSNRPFKLFPKGKGLGGGSVQKEESAQIQDATPLILVQCRFDRPE